MRVLIFGGTGMVGQAVLRECLLDAGIDRVILVGRTASAATDAKVEQHVVADVTVLDAIRPAIETADVCFWCLGVSSAGLGEAAYRRITRELAVGAATALAAWNPAMTFVFVSGTGADSTERGRVMWARVKGETENALFRLPFKAVHAVRPAFIQPRHGITSRTALYRAFYLVTAPLFPIFRRLTPGAVTTTEDLGRAMIALARHGAEKRVLEQPDLNALVPKVAAA